MPVRRITVTESFAEIDPTEGGSALDQGTWDLAIGNIFTGNSARLPGG